MTTIKSQSDRAVRSAARLAEVHSAAPEKRHQAIDSWLELATGGEVRKHWRSWMGRLPAWAVRAA